MMRLPIVAVVIFIATIPAAAHSGPGEPAGLFAGLLHPASGIDHVLAMLSLGAWAAAIGGRALWLLPLAFLVGAGLGGSLASMHVSLPAAEPLILASALFLTLFALLRLKLHGTLAVALAFAFAIAHGHSHATEVPAGVPALAAGLGFLAGSGLLLLAGIAIARGLRRYLTSSTDVRAPRTTS